MAALLAGGLIVSALAPLLPAEEPAGAALPAVVRSPAGPPGGSAGSSLRSAGASQAVSRTPPVRQVWVEGDSVIVAAADAVRSSLQADAWRAVVAGWPGLHVWAAVPILSQVRPRMGSVAVIELGDNDCCDGAAFGRTLDQAMAAVPGIHVIWLTGTATRPGQDATNAAIRAAVLRWPNLEVADWATFVAQHPEAVFPDGVHLTPQGEVLMASFVRDHLDAWYRRASTPTSTLAASSRPAARGTRR